ncbi:hypothetical protein DV515_00007207 [Chloebia gouldiae]|uniref:Uncharacterized protein n=1 Tax=Chloebia gouldiae TaxID=44316 RepID=A0A3L8SIG5_CHLGU|nr:hypothetical protein DV515_00007207 [Chloebia gouldiae]
MVAVPANHPQTSPFPVAYRPGIHSDKPKAHGGWDISAIKEQSLELTLLNLALNDRVLMKGSMREMR